ncbi:AAA family ATPase, partial [Thiomicrospira microaerophila]|uniref:AAA family ATPase n=1 Tax=Thiomicrospira microaerophila TaxID=406020 RepID=UPI0005C9CB76
MKKLPIGIQTFSMIRENDFIYIDKTPLIHKLVNSAGRFFLSRPRRFGKSLLVDTLKELFEGNQAWFQGLYIEDKWDWAKTYPVVHLNFSD